MARLRSPNYPSMGLPDAIDRVRVVHEREQHLAAPREVMARHLGYASLNGTSLKALSALLKYGLFEKTKDDKRKVSDLAVQILHPRTPDERASAIREAAFRPALFAEIAKEWPDGNPSDENLRAYLVRKKFASDAIAEVIESYRSTLDLVAREGGGYAAPNSQPEGGKTERPMVPQQTHVQSGGRHSAGSEEPPFRVSFVPGGIEVVARITDLENADELVKTINALKLLLKPATDVKGLDEEAAN